MVIGAGLPFAVGDVVRLVATTDAGRQQFVGRTATVVSLQPGNRRIIAFVDFADPPAAPSPSVPSVPPSPSVPSVLSPPPDSPVHGVGCATSHAGPVPLVVGVDHAELVQRFSPTQR